MSMSDCEGGEMAKGKPGADSSVLVTSHIGRQIAGPTRNGFVWRASGILGRYFTSASTSA